MKYCRPTQRAPDPSTGSGTAGGSLRVFKHFSWLGVDSVKAAWSRPAWWLSLSKPTSTPQGHNASRWAERLKLVNNIIIIGGA